jgi:DNA-binding SARP family transcriptional activator
MRLLLAANQPVPDDRLAFDLWVGTPPAGAASTLASHVSLLRKALGSERIRHHGGGYSLVVHPHELDSAEFESDVIAGSEALRQGRPLVAADRFERGLQRWRGSALAEVDGVMWAHGAIARLEELRLGAVESLLDVRLSLGQHREIVAAAETSVREHPLRERGWAILMTALYRSGRQAEALRAYQRLRTHLAEQLGVEPSRELADLEESMILQSPDLRWPSASPLTSSEKRSGSPRVEVCTVLVARTRSQGAEPVPSEPDGCASLLADMVALHDGRSIRMDSDDLVALFDSPADAMAASAALQIECTTFHDHHGLRIALAIGEVTSLDGIYVGAPIDDALDLAGRARPGDILVAGAVRMTSGRNSPFSFTELGEAGLGRDPGAGSLLSLEWTAPEPVDGQIPLVGALHQTGAAFVGRDDQRRELERLVSLAAGGDRQIALVGGEPGIGKTSLVAEVARHVHATGGTVLYGRCLEVAGVPYHPFNEALGHYIDHASLDALSNHVARFGGDLSRLLPGLSQRLPEAPAPTVSDGDTERYLAYRSAIGLLVAASLEHTVLLVLEDLHWADSETMVLLRHLASSLDRSALVILGTFRSTEVTPDHPLSPVLAALWRESCVSRVHLGGLSATEVQELCRSMTGRALDEGSIGSLAMELQRETAGNPFFVGELLRHLAESEGTGQGSSAGWWSRAVPARADLPDSLQEVITHRIHHLGAKAERVLTLAAAIGQTFDVATLTDVTDVDPDALLDLLERAQLAALLDDENSDGAFTFTHALIRRALYGGLQPVRRRQLHARVAAALEKGPTPPSLLAYHYLAAGLQEQGLVNAERAASVAFNAMAPTEAARWYAEARALLERLHPEDRLRLCDLVTQEGVSLRLAGDPTYREVLLDAVAIARQAGDGRRLAAAALANTRGFYSAAGQRDQDRLDSLRLALELLGDDDPAFRARLLATLCSESVFGASLDDRRSLADQAKGEARALGDPRTILEVNNLVIETLRYPTELPERLDDTAIALHLADQLGDPAALFWAIGHRMRTLVEAGHVEEAASHFTRMAEVSDQLGQPIMQWMTLFTRAQWSFLRGDTAAGEAQADEALQLGSEIGQPDAFNYYATQVSHARWQQGRLAEILDLIEQGTEDNPGIPAYRGALARAYCQAGRASDATALLEEASAGRFSDLPEDLLWTYGMVTFAEAAIQLEHVESAAILYETLAPFGHQISYLGTTCEGPIAHYLGGLAIVLGEYEAAERHLKAASAFAGQAQSPFFDCRASIEAGRLATRTGDMATARRLLGTGRTTAERGGFSAEARRADDLMAALA